MKMLVSCYGYIMNIEGDLQFPKPDPQGAPCGDLQGYPQWEMQMTQNMNCIVPCKLTCEATFKDQ